MKRTLTADVGSGFVLAPVGEAAVESTGLSVQMHRLLVDGVAVFGAGVNVLTRDGLMLGGNSSLPVAATRQALQWSERDAVLAVAATYFGANVTVSADDRGHADPQLARFVLSRPDWRPVTVGVRRWWYPAADGLLPAYQLAFLAPADDADRPNARSLLISAADGRVLRDVDLIRDLRRGNRHDAVAEYGRRGVRYNVLADRDGTPYIDPYGFTVPHPTGVSDGSVPTTPQAGHVLRRQHAGIGTHDPWLPPQATETRGNNVDAFFKAVPATAGVYDSPYANWYSEFNAAAGDFRALVTAPDTFDYAYDVAMAPDDYFQLPGAPAAPIPVDSTQLNAKIVQSFYTANWLHDLFYDVGFDEVAGNMQSDNYGRGGIGGDPLIVHAGYGNTFAFAPEDGISPALTVGLNTFSASNRDASGFDFGVFVHEWTHTMFGRLTTMAHTGQPAAINEGTADFVAMFLMVRAHHRDAPPATDAFHGAYPVGAYVNLDYADPFSGEPPAGSAGRPDTTYYHGIRRFPYSASLAVNPLTFAHISPDHPLPDGFEPFDWKGRGSVAYEIHTAGEVWAAALWQCARNLLAETGGARQFRATHRRFLAYLVAGLKLFPLDATYTEARDAVLMAVRAGSEADYVRCRAGFAERGLGADAVSPPRDSIEFRSVVESFVDADPPALR